LLVDPLEQRLRLFEILFAATYLFQQARLVAVSCAEVHEPSRYNLPIRNKA
jgi:hypothetical protein